MAIHPNALRKAADRLRLAEKTVSDLAKCKSYEEFSDTWYVFLVAAKNVYVALERGSERTARDRQWFGAKNRERREDPLLQYLYQSRDDAEHGIEPGTEHVPGQLNIGVAKPGFSRNMSISLTTDGMGRPTIHELKSLDGKPVLVEQTKPHIRLIKVTGRGGTEYHPPTSHLGTDLKEGGPLNVAKLAVTYLARLIEEARNRA